jgi:hypothetical protein
MTNYPETAVKVTSIEPAGKAKFRIIFEMIAHVDALAVVGEEMFHEAMD